MNRPPTPPSAPHHCPVCKAKFAGDPDLLFGNATCSSCGSELWFLNLGARIHVFERRVAESVRPRVVAIVCQRLPVDPAAIAEQALWDDDLIADSVTAVELVLEIEEELGLR